jgi:hypothetical protein
MATDKRHNDAASILHFAWRHRSARKFFNRG